VQGDAFNQGAYFQSPKTKELMFGGYGGMNIFKPADFARDETPAPAVITGFKLFNEEKNLGRPLWTLPPIELGYRDSVFSIELAALSYADPKRNSFSYRLEGLHDEWLTTSEPSVTYSNLDGGDYVFQVKAAGRHGVWSEPIALSLDVAYPPWKTWWAMLIYASVAAGLAFAYQRYQSQRVETVKKENRLAAVERDLELTGAVQTGFLPKQSIVADHKFRLHGFYKPADRCSGDWWWHQERDGQRYWVLVGDVTGHGPGPAMVTAAVATAFRTQARNGHGASMQQVLSGLHDEVATVGAGRYQMTLSAVEVDAGSGEVTIHSAGGMPVIRLSAAGESKVITCRGLPLGSETFKANTKTEKLQVGERLLVLTDGIPELQRTDGKMIGLRGIAKLFEETRGKSIAEGVAHIVENAEKIRGGRIQEDDWTFAIIERS
jgi:serine phosphatase RsbU (regulator of sigma subunit)